MDKEIWKPGNMLYPLPVVMVSCARPDEKPNIITVAWAGTVCSSPAMVSISVRPERWSHAIIEETGEFVINLVTQKLIRSCDWCGVKSGRDVDKFEARHLTAQPAKLLRYAPLIEESPVNIECRVTQKIPLGSHDMFLAEVVSVDVDPTYMDEKKRFDLNAAGLAAYSHGEYYALGKKLGTFGYSVRTVKGGKGTKPKLKAKAAKSDEAAPKEKAAKSDKAPSKVKAEKSGKARSKGKAAKSDKAAPREKGAKRGKASQEIKNRR